MGPTSTGTWGRMREPRLVIFGINYAPEPTGIATNTTWLAESLVSLGWRVTVVTGIPHYPDWRRAPLPRRPENGPASLLRRPHYVPATQSALRRGAYELSWLASALPATRAARGADVYGYRSGESVCDVEAVS